MEEQHAESVATLKGPAYSVTSEVSHQHKFPEGGKLDVPSAPKEKTLHFPVPKDINPKSGFTIPPGALEKPPIPDTSLNIETTEQYIPTEQESPPL